MGREVLHKAFDGLVSSVEDVAPRQSNLEQLIREWNARRAQLGIEANSPQNDVAFLVPKLDFADFELLKQITSLGTETLGHCLKMREHASKSSTMLLDKLEQRAGQKQQQLRRERAEKEAMQKRAMTAHCPSESQ